MILRIGPCAGDAGRANQRESCLDGTQADSSIKVPVRSCPHVSETPPPCSVRDWVVWKPCLTTEDPIGLKEPKSKDFVEGIYEKVLQFYAWTMCIILFLTCVSVSHFRNKRNLGEHHKNIRNPIGPVSLQQACQASRWRYTQYQLNRRNIPSTWFFLLWSAPFGAAHSQSPASILAPPLTPPDFLSPSLNQTTAPPSGWLFIRPTNAARRDEHLFASQWEELPPCLLL